MQNPHKLPFDGLMLKIFSNEPKKVLEQDPLYQHHREYNVTIYQEPRKKTCGRKI